MQAPAKAKALTAGPSKDAVKPKAAASKKKPLKDRDNLPSQDASDDDMDFDPSPKPKAKTAAAGSKKTASETYQKAGTLVGQASRLR